MRKVAGILAVLLLAAWPAAAQFNGYVGLQTVYTRVLNATTTTGRTVVNANIGASFHTFTYCASSTVTALVLFIEESPDGAANHFAQISPTYSFPSTVINGNACAVIRVGGYYSVLAVNVATLTGGSLSVWYTATAGPADVYPPAVNSSGGASAVQCDRSVTLDNLAPATIYELEPGNSTQTIYVCGGTLSFNAATTAGEIFLMWGTTANCGGLANAAKIFNVYTTATTPQIFPINTAGNAFFKAPASGALPPNNLCLSIGAVGANTAITLSWAQF